MKFKKRSLPNVLVSKQNPRVANLILEDRLMVEKVLKDEMMQELGRVVRKRERAFETHSEQLSWWELGGGSP